MKYHVVLLSIPGLREEDLARMPALSRVMASGDCSALVPSFPCLTWPVQANMLTGVRPAEHGVIANGFYWRNEHRVEMWTAGNERIEAPQIWDRLHEQDPRRSSAVWFPMLSKRSSADYVCMPAPVHHPDGTESLWCYTKPTELYGALRDRYGHFPLQRFWGPLANIESSAWIGATAVDAADRFWPDFFYIYLPHLDYAAQRDGPDSPAALEALAELDTVLDRLCEGMRKTFDGHEVLLLVASEYVITPVDHVVYPNRVLREAGLLQVETRDDGEHLDLAASQAWALADHQCGHVFVRQADAHVVRRVAELFEGRDGIGRVLAGDDLRAWHMNHERSGEVVLVSAPTSWQAYYWWLDDAQAPAFARTVDIHRKPGYDPVELCFDAASRSIPLRAELIRGSHGAPAETASQRGVLLASRTGVLRQETYHDYDLAGLVLNEFAR
jgi:predicted AlkP superfamily pyrophosphatase or phosphodiesterase